MKCSCCDVILTPQESVRKFKESGMYTDTCSRCLREIGLPTEEGKNYSEINDEDIDVEYDEAYWEDDSDPITDEVEDWE